VRHDRRAGSDVPPTVWFAYSPDRKGKHPRQHLKDFRGVLQADAYAGADCRSPDQPQSGTASLESRQFTGRVRLISTSRKAHQNVCRIEANAESCFMVRTVLGIALFLSTGLLATSQDIDSQGSPTIRLNLPQDIPSDTIDINYFMTGHSAGMEVS
jgi:hypothetical protein